MKYKVGSKVRIQPLEWYQKELESAEYYLNIFDIYWCSREMTISKIEKSRYLMEEDGQEFYWTDEMIEGLVEEETKPNIIEGAKTYWDSIKDAWICPEGYIFKDENGNVINATKIVLEKKKKEYPKTYEECCKILGVDPDNYLTIRNVHCYDGEEETIKYERDLLDKFDSLWELIICRDAYWKIAGEEMGLGKPWKPDWKNDNQFKSVITCCRDNVNKDTYTARNTILAFLTKEMRDAFYENFKELIESCKELL